MYKEQDFFLMHMHVRDNSLLADFDYIYEERGANKEPEIHSEHLY
jgi:hypothetical protein